MKNEKLLEEEELAALIEALKDEELAELLGALFDILCEKLEDEKELAEALMELNCELLAILELNTLLLELDWLMLWLLETEALTDIKFAEELFEAELLKLL